MFFVLALMIATGGLCFAQTPVAWMPTDYFSSEYGTASDFFGTSVAICGKGQIVVVGSPGVDRKGDSDRGAAYVIPVNSDGKWQTASSSKLLAQDGAANDNFGYSVAISGDSSTIVIGAYGKDNWKGAAYVYSLQGNEWKEVAKLVAPDGTEGSWFGKQVAISRDGSTIVIGAERGNQRAGAVYVYTKPSGGWSSSASVARLTMKAGRVALHGGRGSFFGTGIAVSDDGGIVLAGAPEDNQAFIFRRPSGGWSHMNETEPLAPSDKTDYFGTSVALSGDGNLATVTSIGMGTAKGYVFQYVDEEWVPVAQLQPSEKYADDFGCAVAMSRDGKVIAIGAKSQDPVYQKRQGVVYMFVQEGNRWRTTQEKMYLLDNKGQNADDFGASVGVSVDGKIILAGAPHNDANGNSDQGSVSIFR